MGRVFATVVAVSAMLLSGCGENGVISRFMLKPDHIIIERRPDRAYDKLFPYYVELCATSQFRSKLKGEGGVAGHAVMYIKGACKDEQATYPQLRRCSAAATEVDDPEHGAGISRRPLVSQCQLGSDPGLRPVLSGQSQSRRASNRSPFRCHSTECDGQGYL
jgi:hypothetical protein